MKEVTQIETRQLFENREFEKAVEIGLQLPQKTEHAHVEDFTEYYLSLAYAIYSATESNLYEDQQKLYKKFSPTCRGIYVEPPIGYHNQAAMFQSCLSSAIFNHYNTGFDYNQIIFFRKKLIRWTKKVPDFSPFEEVNGKLEKLVDEILINKDPYYTVKFTLPISLPLPSGEYKLTAPNNAVSISIVNFQSHNITSDVRDRFFSKVEIKYIGFTCTDNHWQGPSIDTNTGVSWNLERATDIVNDIILKSKLLNRNLRSKLVNPDDLGTSTTTQFFNDGTEFHFTIAFGFGGHSSGDILSPQVFEGGNLDEIKQALLKPKLPLYKEIHSRALIDKSNSNYKAAFFSLNSACESMIDYFIKIILGKNGFADQYEDVILGNSYCEKCELYIRLENKDKFPLKRMSASPFGMIMALKRLALVDNKKRKEIQSLISKIRNDTLRNDLTHGRISNIPKKAIQNSFNNFDLLENELLSLSTMRLLRDSD